MARALIAAVVGGFLCALPGALLLAYLEFGHAVASSSGTTRGGWLSYPFEPVWVFMIACAALGARGGWKLWR